MKVNQKQFMENLVECAREIYVQCYSLATESDFCRNRTALDELHYEIIDTYYKYRKKRKKLFKILIYTSGAIYNNEMFVDSDLCYSLNILIAIHQLRLYKAHKFIQFVENKCHVKYIVPGIKYSELNTLVNKLLRGVKCC